MLLTAILDACVLFSASLRDILLRSADADLYTMQITDEILEETRRNLINKRNLTKIQGQRLVEAVTTSFKENFVSDYQILVGSMPINEKDRHVLAAAVACEAQIIVTHNLKDFPQDLLASYKIKAQSPDEFLVQLFQEKPLALKKVLTNQAAQLRHPPLTVLEVLDRLKQEAPNFVQIFCNKFESLDS